MIVSTQREGIVSWKSPSNIALVKYWGKYDVQLPRNASISFTLNNAYTEMSIHYYKLPQTSEKININFLFEGMKNEKFEKKIESFLSSIINHFPFLTEYQLSINSQNSFPHSTGIASSASSMS